jgi:hypothetical protein
LSAPLSRRFLTSALSAFSSLWATKSEAKRKRKHKRKGGGNHKNDSPPPSENLVVPVDPPLPRTCAGGLVECPGGPPLRCCAAGDVCCPHPPSDMLLCCPPFSRCCDPGPFDPAGSCCPITMQCCGPNWDGTLGCCPQVQACCRGRLDIPASHGGACCDNDCCPLSTADCPKGQACDHRGCCIECGEGEDPCYIGCCRTDEKCINRVCCKKRLARCTVDRDCCSDVCHFDPEKGHKTCGCAEGNVSCGGFASGPSCCNGVCYIGPGGDSDLCCTGGTTCGAGECMA